MGRSRISKLALAIAAAGFFSSVLPGVSFELTASQVIQNVAQHVAANRTTNALQLIAQLRTLGITQIRFGTTIVSIAQLEALVRSGSAESMATLNGLVASALSAGNSSFTGSNGELVATLDSEDVPDAFPLSSTG